MGFIEIDGEKTPVRDRALPGLEIRNLPAVRAKVLPNDTLYRVDPATGQFQPINPDEMYDIEEGIILDHVPHTESGSE